MHQDDLIWECISHKSPCVYKSSSSTAPSLPTFCRNPYNLTGFCSRQACPLANSRYAAVTESQGKIFLHLKTPERITTPDKTWQKILLPRNYLQALSVLDDELEFYPNAKFLLHRSKQRLTKLHQMLIRKRKLRLKTKMQSAVASKTLEAVKKKEERQEKSRERKALAAAKVEKTIEEELLNRLKSGKYGDLHLEAYEKAIEKLQEEEFSESETEIDEEEEVEFVEEEEEDDEEEIEHEIEDIEDMGDFLQGRIRKGSVMSSVSEKSLISEKSLQSESSEQILLRYGIDITGKGNQSTSEKARKKKKARVEVEYEEDSNANSQKELINN